MTGDQDKMKSKEKIEFQRLEILIGEEKMKMLEKKHIAVFGLGGVGGYAAEALARSGIGKLTLIDYDLIDITNLNRQLIALQSTIGKNKAEIFGERLRQINPSIRLRVLPLKYTEENWRDFFTESFDYIVDAIDMVSSKIHLIVKADELGIPLISCMGMGNKMDPTRIQAADIYKTHTCPLAKVMRRELKARGIRRLKTVFSDEEPMKPLISISSESKREVPGSTAFVPSAAGLVMASQVLRDFLL